MRCWWLRCARLLVAISFVGCLLAQAQPARATQEPATYVPGEVIVRLIPPLLGSVETLVQTIASQFGLQVVDRLGTLPVFRLKIIGNVLSPPALAGLLDALPAVLYAEPNFLGQSPEGVARSSWSRGGDAGGVASQWAPGMIRLDEAHTISRGAGVVVAVLDTGADLDHPALAGHLAPGYDFVDLDADPSEEGAYGQDIAYGHGTHVAGLVALAAPEATIVPLRILRPDGSGDSWVLAQALRYAVGLPVPGITPVGHNADVINISYSVRQRSLLLDDVLGLLAALPGSPVVVAAAGNRGPSIAKEYPAGESTPGVLAVAASTEADTLADFSTRGSWVDVAAPGENILSSVPDNDYGVWSGTSMAAPLAAGVAALVRARYPSFKPAQVTGRIISQAHSIDASVSRRVDAAAALGLPAAGG
jgi:subtilisin family serine protease